MLLQDNLRAFYGIYIRDNFKPRTYCRDNYLTNVFDPFSGKGWYGDGEFKGFPEGPLKAYQYGSPVIAVAGALDQVNRILRRQNNKKVRKVPSDAQKRRKSQDSVKSKQLKLDFETPMSNDKNDPASDREEYNSEDDTDFESHDDTDFESKDVTDCESKDDTDCESKDDTDCESKDDTDCVSKEERKESGSNKQNKDCDSEDQCKECESDDEHGINKEYSVIKKKQEDAYGGEVDKKEKDQSVEEGVGTSKMYRFNSDEENKTYVFESKRFERGKRVINVTFFTFADIKESYINNLRQVLKSLITERYKWLKKGEPSDSTHINGLKTITENFEKEDETYIFKITVRYVIGAFDIVMENYIYPKPLLSFVDSFTIKVELDRHIAKLVGEDSHLLYNFMVAAVNRNLHLIDEISKIFGSDDWKNACVSRNKEGSATEQTNNKLKELADIYQNAVKQKASVYTHLYTTKMPFRRGKSSSEKGTLYFMIYFTPSHTFLQKCKEKIMKLTQDKNDIAFSDYYHHHDIEIEPGRKFDEGDEAKFILQKFGKRSDLVKLGEVRKSVLLDSDFPWYAKELKMLEKQGLVKALTSDGTEMKLPSICKVPLNEETNNETNGILLKFSGETQLVVEGRALKEHKMSLQKAKKKTKGKSSQNTSDFDRKQSKITDHFLRQEK